MYTERLTWSRVWWVVLFSPVITVLVLIALGGSEARAADSLAAFGVMAGIFLAVAYAFRALELTITDRELTVGFPLSRQPSRFVRKYTLRMKNIRNHLTKSLLSLYSPYKITLLHSIGLIEARSERSTPTFSGSFPLMTLLISFTCQ